MPTCPLYGDGSLWGDGDLWCRQFGSEAYITYLDKSSFTREFLDTWNLQSPDGTIWTPSLKASPPPSTVTFISGVGAASEVPIALGADGITLWTPTIDNQGIVTLTDGASDTGQRVATLLDEFGRPWYWLVNASSNARWDRFNLPGFTAVQGTHFSTEITFIGSSNFVIQSIRPLASVIRQEPARFITHTDVDDAERLSIQVQYAGGTDFSIDRITVIANTRQRRPVS